MKVYIEYVIIDNFMLDYLLLKLTFTAKKCTLIKHGLLFGAFVGSIFAVIMPLINLPEIVLFFIKILSGVIMLLCTAKFKNFSSFFSAFNLLLILTFAFGGAIYAFFTFINVNYSIIFNTSEVFPLGLVLGLSMVVYKALYKFFCKFYHNKLIYPFVRECKIIHKGRSICINGFIDSGNQLVFNNFYSVCVAGKRLVNQLLNQGFLQEGAIGEMKISTVSGESKIKIFEFDFLEIYSNENVNIIKGVKIGVLQNAITLSEDYDLILSSECVK